MPLQSSSNIGQEFVAGNSNLSRAFAFFLAPRRAMLSDNRRLPSRAAGAPMALLVICRTGYNYKGDGYTEVPFVDPIRKSIRVDSVYMVIGAAMTDRCTYIYT